ncbi:ComF family protein [Methyloradius palustris]|uniref:ComF family protein n=1 Tax=Methyloradius palustris TaxID=2778876 RepID=UPI001CECE01C|nr:ComF family protein [Methyloradius palustris]
MDRWLKFNQLIFPQACMLCATSDGGELAICGDCLADLPRHITDQCPQCALPAYQNQLCGHCIASPPAFDVTHALFRYEFPVDAMLQRYKYQHLLNMAQTFAQMIITDLPNANLPDLIIPMPLHPLRLKERGFNQSLEIARIVGKSLNIKVDTQACSRIKSSPPQASLPLKERVKNMQGAFTFNTQLDGLNIALIDDVMTTGASLNSLAKTVKKAGAINVECWVVARTLPR